MYVPYCLHNYNLSVEIHVEVHINKKGYFCSVFFKIESIKKTNNATEELLPQSRHGENEQPPNRKLNPKHALIQINKYVVKMLF